MSTQEMKDHIPWVAPLKGCGQSRAIGEFKSEKNNKPDVLHPGCTLCPELTDRSSLGQHSQQGKVDKDLNSIWSYKPLSICSLWMMRCTTPFGSFIALPCCYFAFSPVIPKPKPPETWGYRVDRVECGSGEHRQPRALLLCVPGVPE